jgi:hypothetical protein
VNGVVSITRKGAGRVWIAHITSEDDPEPQDGILTMLSRIAEDVTSTWARIHTILPPGCEISLEMSGTTGSCEDTISLKSTRKQT